MGVRPRLYICMSQWSRPKLLWGTVFSPLANLYLHLSVLLSSHFGGLESGWMCINQEKSLCASIVRVTLVQCRILASSKRGQVKVNRNPYVLCSISYLYQHLYAIWIACLLCICRLGLLIHPVSLWISCRTRLSASFGSFSAGWIGIYRSRPVKT